MQKVFEKSYRVDTRDSDMHGYLRTSSLLGFFQDAAGLGARQSAFVSEMQIGFLSEGFPGEDIYMFSGRENEYTYILGADEKGKGIFDARLKITDTAL